ncbi:uncharacterized protein DNG_04889 [Cephalotrichum gorgonifer]|uniref:Meiotic expression up-regulated protein 6 PH domain-containing protein n=1 Tax=Cephalotrichum gorgonifer TaxID=2041049 RepID=A0AAE8MX05_9PEZI|nr:uncharacterized protein DNG_04889 [Cephalotrichum gorgonifer]
MADQQKPAEVVQDAPAVETPAETKPVEAAAAEETPAAEATPAAATEAPAAEAAAEPAAETTEPPPAAEDKKEEEPTPVEEGTLEHKGAGANFPKNLYYSKQPFWFGSDALEKKSLAAYLKHEKSTVVAYHNASWAQSTGKGLLFFGDKTAPTGIINLAEATEPQTDGPNKFHFAANGQKHSFKAANKAEADNWVSQLKVKIAEAKEVAATIKDTEEYKAAYEIYKPTPAKKEEKKEEEAPAEAAAEPEAAKEEPAAEEPAAAEPAAEEAKKDEEPAKEEEVKEEAKRRSASRKRTSVLGFFGKKDKKEEEKPAEAAAEPVAEAEPAAEAEAAPAAAAAEETPAAAETPAAEDKPAEEAASPKEKPALPSKRNSFFGLLKKDKKPAEAEAAPATPAKDAEVPASSEAAPVIPPVETSAPLATEEAAAPAEAAVAEAKEAPVTNGETKKSEKRKSALPFLGKKDKVVSSDEEGEKPKSPSTFSKLRATIKGRTAKPAAAAEKAEEKAEETKPAEEAAAEEAKPAEAEASEPAKPAEEAENKPESAAAAPAPAVTAAA